MADIQELKDYRKLYYKADRYARMIEDLRTRLYSVKITDYQREHVDGGVPNAAQEALIDRLESVEKEYVETIKVLHSKMKEIENRVDSLPFPYNEVLMRYYCQMNTFERIAVDLNYNYRWVQRLHRKGMQKYKEAV